MTGPKNDHGHFQDSFFNLSACLGSGAHQVLLVLSCRCEDPRGLRESNVDAHLFAALLHDPRVRIQNMNIERRLLVSKAPAWHGGGR